MPMIRNRQCWWLCHQIVLMELGLMRPRPQAALQRGKPTYSVERLGFPLRALFHLQSIESDNSRQVFVEPSRDDPGEVSTFWR
jgi:hypothetical protein